MNSLVDPSPSHSGTPKKTKDVDWVVVGLELAWSLVITTVSGCLILYLSRHLSRLLTTEEGAPKNPSKICARLEKILQKRGNHKPIPELTSFELQMAEEVLDPDDIEGE
jgi:hypothetical protein